MNPGDKLIATAYGGQKIVRVLVEVIETKAFICTEEEWSISQKEKRYPVCVGFPLKDVEKLIA
jgi:hypothetical protein